MNAAASTIKKYVQANIIPTKPGRRCVDGRYLPNTEDSGMIARPGADFGYVMILLCLSEKHNLGLTPEQCFDKVYQAITEKIGELFYMHTDHHADPTLNEHIEKLNPIPHTLNASIGCGHAAKPMSDDFCSQYELIADDERKLVAYAKQKYLDDRNSGKNAIRMVNLEGEHKEQAVIIITGIKNTINSYDGKDMYFIFDKTRDNEFMKKLIPLLNVKDLTFDEFKAKSDKHLTATLHNLACGLPIFEVNVDTKIPLVTSKGMVK